MIAANGHRLNCEFTIGEAIGQLVIWILLAIVTLGLALILLPYYYVRAPINRTYLVDPAGRKVGRLNVDFGFGDIIGHALLWLQHGQRLGLGQRPPQGGWAGVWSLPEFGSPAALQQLLRAG